MTAALILRGHAFRVPNDGYSSRSWGTDWRRSIESQRKFLIEPLRAKYQQVKLILCSYSSDHDAAVIRDYGADVWLLGQPGASQRQTAVRVLDAAIEFQRMCGSFDFVVMTRFDVEFLSVPWEQPGFVEGKVNFLWREWNDASWHNHRRVPDVIHQFPGRFLEQFRASVADPPSEVCLHTIYYPLARRIGEENIQIMNPDGFCDSNSDWCGNPIYKLVWVM